MVEAAKGLRDFSRDNPALVIKGGVLDGKALTPDEITRLADLEPREVLLARLAGAMTASMARAAAVFNALPTQVAQLLEALRVQRAEQGPTEAARRQRRRRPPRTRASTRAEPNGESQPARQRELTRPRPDLMAASHQ